MTTPPRIAYSLGLLLLLISAGLLCSTRKACANSIRDPIPCSVFSVTDGDTLHVDCGWRPLAVRLHCVDAPELGQRGWGSEARARFVDLLDRDVFMRLTGSASYGRLVAQVLIPETGQDIGLLMVREGFVVLDPRYCRDPDYLAAEADAIERQAGVWAVPGLHQRPWDYRAARRPR